VTTSASGGDGWRRWRHLDPRTPVVVGAAQASQELDEPGAGLGPIGLMVAAARAAGHDSGAPRLLATAQRVAVPEGTWRYRDAARLVARAVGADGARTVVVKAGTPQQTLLDDAYLELRAGRIDVALVVGGEAARRAARARRAGVEPAPDPPAGDGGTCSAAGTGTDDTDPDELRHPEGEIVSPAEIAAGVVSPPEQYALIDSALRHAERQSVDEHRDAVAELWAGFSATAARFPHAADRHRRTAAEIREPGPGNRPIAFPYNKLHCSRMDVDQAAALLVCTLAAAEAAGVDPARVVFPLVALESSFSLPLPRRRDIHRWPAMEVLAAAAAEHLGAPPAALEHAEVYSCFPAAVRVQQRALGLPLDGAPTITGGEPFAGGPWNNFVLQATVAMIDRVRTDRGARGLVTTVSGFLTKPGLAVYATEPGPHPLLVADLADRARTATPALPVTDAHDGPATVAAVTVGYDRQGAGRTIVVADTPGGERCLATSDDTGVAALAATEELVGRSVRVAGRTFRL
jgi:acetyl-CoA C-acetyltransferase